jgi:tetratricopeptide (TPR) repeat protein
MADLGDLASFVAAHPEDYEQRWRLAKKLYMTCDYRGALAHLQILKEEWRPKVNVVRYLAATHYRLGRYEEAVRELHQGISRWPEDIAMREQVARVLEAADRHDAALDSWREIQRLNPDHIMAARAIERLETYLKEESPPELPIGDSDSGLDISGLVCSVCGAQNSAGFSRCWQCHARLDENAAAAAPIAPRHHTSTSHDPDPLFPVTLALGLGAVAALSLSVFLTMRHLAALEGANPAAPVLTLRAYLEWTFAYTRIILGAALAIIWPVALWLSLTMFDSRWESTAQRSAVIGLLAAALCYLTTWLPGAWFLLTPALGAVVTLALMARMLRLKPGPLLGAWALQGALVLVTVVAGFVAMQGIGPLRDIAALARFARATAADPSRIHRAPDLSVNDPMGIQWASTGSRWLDSQPHTAEFMFRDVESNEPLYVELFRGSRIVEGRVVEGVRFSFYESPILPGQAYSLILTGPADVPPVTLIVHSLLRPVFSPL